MTDPQQAELLQQIKELRNEVQSTRRWVVFLAVLAAGILFAPLLARLPLGLQILPCAAGFLWLAATVLGSWKKAPESE